VPLSISFEKKSLFRKRDIKKYDTFAAGNYNINMIQFLNSNTVYDFDYSDPDFMGKRQGGKNAFQSVCGSLVSSNGHSSYIHLLYIWSDALKLCLRKNFSQPWERQKPTSDRDIHLSDKRKMAFSATENTEKNKFIVLCSLYIFSSGRSCVFALSKRTTKKETVKRI
jgi:hypothetical protein